VEKALIKPVGWNGSESESELEEKAGSFREGRLRSGVTRRRGESTARRWKRGCVTVCRSSTTRPQEQHSVTERPPAVTAHRPCVPGQYGQRTCHIRLGWLELGAVNCDFELIHHLLSHTVIPDVFGL
jgi:hypothetical protein